MQASSDGFEDSFQRHLIPEQRRALLETIARELSPDTTLGEVVDAVESLGWGEHMGELCLAELAGVLVQDDPERSSEASDHLMDAETDDAASAEAEDDADDADADDEDDEDEDEDEAEEDAVQLLLSPSRSSRSKSSSSRAKRSSKATKKTSAKKATARAKKSAKKAAKKTAAKKTAAKKTAAKKTAAKKTAAKKLTTRAKKSSKKKAAKKAAKKVAKEVAKKAAKKTPAKKPSKRAASDRKSKSAAPIDDEAMSIEQAARKLVPLVRKYKQATMQDLEEATGLGRRKLRFHVGQLVKHGKLKRHGMGRGTHYTVK